MNSHFLNHGRKVLHLKPGASSRNPLSPLSPRPPPRLSLSTLTPTPLPYSFFSLSLSFILLFCYGRSADRGSEAPQKRLPVCLLTVASPPGKNTSGKGFDATFRKQQPAGSCNMPEAATCRKLQPVGSCNPLKDATCRKLQLAKSCNLPKAATCRKFQPAGSCNLPEAASCRKLPLNLSFRKLSF